MYQKNQTIDISDNQAYQIQNFMMQQQKGTAGSGGKRVGSPINAAGDYGVVGPQSQGTPGTFIP